MWSAALLPIVAALLIGCPRLGHGRFLKKGETCSPSSISQRAIHKNFEIFIEKFGRKYARGSKEYNNRREIFTQRLLEIERHNCNGKNPWKADINKFSDRTDKERRRVLGWRRRAKPHGSSGAASATNFMRMDSKPLNAAHHSNFVSSNTSLPQEKSWTHLNAMQHVRDQGDCGSCWAMAAATVLRAHAELAGTDREFSVQQLVSCTRNEHSCGGTGGCSGATAELAMDYVLTNGLQTEAEFPYLASDEPCPLKLLDQSATPNRVSALLKSKVKGGNDGASIGLSGWITLPENRVMPLKYVLVKMGPVAVSVASDAYWFMYSSGVMKSCNQELPVINHAVVLVGYGNLEGDPYWNLQNSWGSLWGEGGFIRIQRHDKDNDEESSCGIDNEPEVGTACLDHLPNNVTVCGSCGILYDSVVPNFTALAIDVERLKDGSNVQKPSNKTFFTSNTSSSRPSMIFRKNASRFYKNASGVKSKAIFLSIVEKHS